MVKTINTTLLAARNPKRKYAYSLKLDENGQLRYIIKCIKKYE